MESFRISPQEEGDTIIEVLALRYLRLSRKLLRRLIARGAIRVNGRGTHPDRTVGAGDEVTADLEIPPLSSSKPLNLELLYRGPEAVVIDKPAAVSVNPERGKDESPLYDALVTMLNPPGQPRPVRPRIVHRLDKDTTGALLVAISPTGERRLSADLERGAVSKEYLAVVRGEVEQSRGTIDVPLAVNSPKPGRTEVAERGGKESRTDFEIVERFRGFTLLRALPRTGRQHQIRVHLAHIGHPLAVDSLYGRADAISIADLKPRYRPSGRHPLRPLLSGLCLHAHRLSFRPTAGDEPITVEVPLPKAWKALLNQLRKWRALQ